MPGSAGRRIAPLAAVLALLSPVVAPAQHTGAGLTSGDDAFSNFTLRSASPLRRALSGDLAFWGKRAFAGDAEGFRIFDLSGDAPALLATVICPGSPSDPSVWDRDEDGSADLLILSVDRTLTGPHCGAGPVAHDNPLGWEGLRLFDVADPDGVRQIGSVYQDCGSHAHTLIPRTREGRLLVLNSSFPYWPGPSCGPVRGPARGRDPLHGVVQVVEIPLADPAAAGETAELPVVYPGDDGVYRPISDHGFNGGAVGSTGLVDGMRACHDITVFRAAGLAAAACGEQAQMWRLNPATGLPDTGDPLWVFDRGHVDWWASATFTWDGRVVRFTDDSVGDVCPTTSGERAHPAHDEREQQTGTMVFLDAATGELLGEFRLPLLSPGPDAGAACPPHSGDAAPSARRYLTLSEYHRSGSSLIDFTDPRRPREIGSGPRRGSGTWITSWYGPDPRRRRGSVDRGTGR